MLVDCSLVLTTFPADGDADAFARTLVGERLAACVSVLPLMQSIYRWKGIVENAAERQVVIKTTAANLPAVTKRLQALHPYEVPEILVVNIDDASPAYLAWLNDSGDRRNRLVPCLERCELHHRADHLCRWRSPATELCSAGERRMNRQKIAKGLVLLYLLGAIGVLSRFLLTPPGDAADLPMVVWTLPTALTGLIAVYWPFEIPYPFMPAAFGYYGGHLAFFLPSVALISYLAWRLVGGKGS